MVNSVADVLDPGPVWCPEPRFEGAVLDEFAALPAGEHVELVDLSK